MGGEAPVASTDRRGRRGSASLPASLVYEVPAKWELTPRRPWARTQRGAIRS